MKPLRPVRVRQPRKTDAEFGRKLEWIGTSRPGQIKIKLNDGSLSVPTLHKKKGGAHDVGQASLSKNWWWEPKVSNMQIIYMSFEVTWIILKLSCCQQLNNYQTTDNYHQWEGSDDVYPVFHLRVADADNAGRTVERICDLPCLSDHMLLNILPSADSLQHSEWNSQNH